MEQMTTAIDLSYLRYAICFKVMERVLHSPVHNNIFIIPGQLSEVARLVEKHSLLCTRDNYF